jgi:hypothetical protein
MNLPRHITQMGIYQTPDVLMLLAQVSFRAGVAIERNIRRALPVRK